MPKYVNNTLNNNKKIKAVKEFTDREHPRKVFWDKYNYIKDAIKNKEDNIPVSVIFYYGVNGIGKTRLLKQLRLEIEEFNKDTKYISVDYDKLDKFNNNILDTLRYMEADLKSRYNFEFPLFDLAAYKYEIEDGKAASKPELKRIFDDNKSLSFLSGVIQDLPIVGTFAKIASYTYEAKNIISDRFKDKELERKFIKLDDESKDDIEKYLPYYFALDLTDNIKKDKLPFVFMIDTYEKLVNELRGGVYATSADDYLKSDEGLILNIPNTLWVMAGREKLKWEKIDKSWTGTLDQHLLGDLSDVDSKHFLMSAGIDDIKLVDQIYKYAGGSPMLLDMCIDTYYNVKEMGHIPTINDFSGDVDAIVKRFFAYMNDQEKDFTTMLAFLGNWSDNEVESVSRKVIGSFSASLYEKVKDFSFIINEGDKYKVNDSIRKIIMANAPEMIKNKFELHKEEETNEYLDSVIKVDTNNKKNKIVFNTYEGRAKYKEVINKLCRELNEQLDDDIKQEDFQNKIKYLWEKIHEYDTNYFAIIKPELFDIIIDKSKNYKRFKEIILLEAYYNMALRMYSDRTFAYDTYEDYLKYDKKDYTYFVKSYKELKKLDKDKNIYLYPIKSMLSILINPKEYKQSEYKESYRRATKEEIEAYESIYIKEKETNNIYYIELLLLGDKLEAFYRQLDEYKYAYVKQKDGLNFYLSLLFDGLKLEFNGKVGTGYLFSPERIIPLAEKIYNEEKHIAVSALQKKEKINNIAENMKKDFIDTSITKILDVLKNNSDIMTVSILSELINIMNAINDEEVGASSSLKLFKYLLSISDSVLETNDSLFITRYENTIYKYATLNNYSLKFRLDHKKEFNDLGRELIELYSKFQSKNIELFGYNKSDEETNLYNKVRLETEYFTYGDSIWYLREAINKYGEESYLFAMVLDAITSTLSKKATKEIMDVKLNKLKEVFDIIFDYYTKYSYFVHNNPEDNKIEQLNYLNYSIRNLLTSFYHLYSYKYSQNIDINLDDMAYYEDKFVYFHNDLIDNYNLLTCDYEFYMWLAEQPSVHNTSTINQNYEKLIPLINKAIKKAIKNQSNILNIEKRYRVVPFSILSMMSLRKLDEHSKKFLAKESNLGVNRLLQDGSNAVELFRRALNHSIESELTFDAYSIIFFLYPEYQTCSSSGYEAYSIYSEHYREYDTINNCITDKELIKNMKMMLGELKTIDKVIAKETNKDNLIYYYVFQAILDRSMGNDDNSNKLLEEAIKIEKKKFLKKKDNLKYLEMLKESFNIIDDIRDNLPNSSIIRLSTREDLLKTIKE